MPTHTFAQAFNSSMLELLWSLWSEFGVSGWTRCHTHWVIDPEPLILLTAAFGHREPRLRDESLDWCLRFGRYVSLARMRNILKARFSAEPMDLRAAFGAYSATINAHSSQHWPLATKPLRVKPSGKSKLDAFDRPSLLHLRLRALFGVSARAEVLRLFLLLPSAQLAAADLVQEEVGYTKRAVRDALEDLHMAGILEVLTIRNAKAYRLRLEQPTTPLESFGLFETPFAARIRWVDLVAILYRLTQAIEEGARASPITRALEVRRALREIHQPLQRAALPTPPTSIRGEAFLPNFEEWALRLVRSLAEGTAWPPPRDPRAILPRARPSVP